MNKTCADKEVGILIVMHQIKDTSTFTTKILCIVFKTATVGK